MKIIIAPDSFKGSLSAAQAAKAVERGVRRVSKKIKSIVLPMADGGEGTLDALVAAAGGRIRTRTVTGPLGGKVSARYGILRDGKTGIVEMAACAGLTLVPRAKRNPLLTTTYGVGELIRRALQDGCRTIIIGAGGSATVDGGMGMLQALGVMFLDRARKPLGRGGRELARIHSINADGLHPAFAKAEVIVAADVDNPLCGPNGAARVFGPQKGAGPEAVRALERGLERYAARIKRHFKKDVRRVPGTGAAGGLAAGAAAFLNASIVSGIDLVLERSKFEIKLIDADLVITGEGRTDAQTISGKAPCGVARLARKHRVPVVCLSGGLGSGLSSLRDEGITAFQSIIDSAMTIEEAMENAAPLLERAAENAVRLFAYGKAL